MSTTPQGLKILVRPCNSGMCPTLYSDSSGKIYVQGTKLTLEERGDIEIANHEEVVEITPELLGYLKAY